MTVKELKDRIACWENLHSEFKEWPIRPDDIASTLVAFANTDGGQLIFGVANNGNIKGVDDVDQVMRQVDNIAANNCEPPIRMWKS